MNLATPQQILKEMNLTFLKEAARLQNVELDAKTCAPYVAILERKSWNNDQLIKLIEILKRSRKNYETYSPAQIVKSDDLPAMSSQEILDNLKSSPPQKTENNQILSGFEDLSMEANEISGIFTGIASRIVIIAKEALLENKIISIPFSIFRDKGYVLIKTSKLKEGRLCREKLMEILELDKLYFAIPEGIREEGIKVQDYNGRARDFIQSLDIEEINGVFLKIGGDTRITGINYKGNGDILEEAKIKSDIGKGALLTGIKGLIRHEELLVDFSVKWGWIPSIQVRGEGISKEIIDQILLVIYTKYIENMLK